MDKTIKSWLGQNLASLIDELQVLPTVTIDFPQDVGRGSVQELK